MHNGHRAFGAVGRIFLNPDRKRRSKAAVGGGDAGGAGARREVACVRLGCIQKKIRQ